MIHAQYMIAMVFCGCVQICAHRQLNRGLGIQPCGTTVWSVQVEQSDVFDFDLACSYSISNVSRCTSHLCERLVKIKHFVAL